MSNNIRLFNIPDSALLQSGEIMVVSLPDDNPAFTDFDSTISPQYPEAIRGAIDRVKAIHPDDVILQEQADLTLRVNTAHDRCYTSYQTIAYFVRKAFAHNPAMQRKFGLREFKNVQDNKNKFIRFMEELSKLSEEHKEVLIKAGCNPSAISELPAIARGLLEADRDQEKFKKDRGVFTQDRIGNLNELYTLLQPIDEVAQIIFRDDPARLSKYMLPRPPKSASGPPAGKGPAPEQLS